MADVALVLRTTSLYTVTKNNQRRVIYAGYWLSDADIPSLVDAWLAANITHVLLSRNWIPHSLSQKPIP